MPRMAEHVFDRDVYHHVWDREIPTALTVEPGDVVHFDVLMAGERQIADGFTYADCSFDFDTLYNLSGPIDVAGAEVGDTIEIEILSLETGPYGWCAFLEGVGLLPDDFPEPYVHHFDLTKGATTRLCDGVEIPITPFCGTMGTCPDKPGRHVPFPPHEGGGNMDTRHLTAGSTLFLPVFHEGGRLSMGDGHAAQGDGEVCGTAIETPMRALVRLTVRKDLHVTGPEFLTADVPPVAAGRRYATDGVAPDLVQAARDAVHRMMDWLGREHGIAPIDAYLLTSVAIDLRISEIVDMPNYVVTAHCPLSIFE
jgi:acetamidase/formamidase